MGELDAKVANCVGVLSGVLLRAIEGDGLSKDMEALRTEIEAMKDAGRTAGAVEEVEGDGVWPS